MKSLNMYLGSVIDNDDLHFESLLADDDIFLDPEKDKKVVEEWIKNNYIIAGRLTVKNDFVVDCSGDVFVKNRNIESLTNGMFRWGKVKTYFYCQHCDNLKSLEGAPKEVGGSFYCDHCDKLETLEGAPEKVNEDFWCNDCNNLKSLEGAPKKVGGYFYCRHCDNLKSLEGAPKEVGRNFSCSNCENLKTLDGAPKKVGEKFFCRNCDNLKITDSDRKKYKIVQ